MKPTRVPEYLDSTVQMLRGAFPTGLVLGDDLVVLMAVMTQDGGMSLRSVANAIAHHSELSYPELLYHANFAVADPRATEPARRLMRERLRPFGYDAWVKEL